MILISSYFSYSKIKDESCKVYRKKYGSLFNEFKNNKGFLSTQYYSLFFTRRFAYLICQVYLNEYPYVQAAIHILFSLVNIGFLGYFKPFRQTSIFISNIAGEACIFIVFSVSVSFIGDTSDDVAMILENVIIYSVFMEMGAQFMVSIFELYNAVKMTWIKIQKIRSQRLIKKSGAEARNSAAFL